MSDTKLEALTAEISKMPPATQKRLYEALEQMATTTKSTLEARSSECPAVVVELDPALGYSHGVDDVIAEVRKAGMERNRIQAGELAVACAKIILMLVAAL